MAHGTVKDAKLYPGGARAWDWRTQHDPGIQPADVVELLEHGAEVVVLSRGVLRMLKVCPETLAPDAALRLTGDAAPVLSVTAS